MKCRWRLPDTWASAGQGSDGDWMCRTMEVAWGNLDFLPQGFVFSVTPVNTLHYVHLRMIVKYALVIKLHQEM